MFVVYPTGNHTEVGGPEKNAKPTSRYADRIQAPLAKVIGIRSQRATPATDDGRFDDAA
jgi:hypothetical protein